MGRGWRALALGLALLAAACAARPERAPEPAALGPDALALSLYRAGQYEQALPRFERMLAAAEARYSKDAQQLALALNNVGELYRRLGRYERAEPLFLRAVELARNAGDESRGLGGSLNNLALLYREQGRLSEAVSLQEQALAAFERTFGPDHPNVATSLGNLAALHVLRAEPGRAKPLQERALAIAEQSLGRGHPTTEELRQALAALTAPAARVRLVGNQAAPPRPKPTLVAARPAASPPVRKAAPRLPQARPPAPPQRFAVLVSSLRDPGAISEEWLMLRRQFPHLSGLDLHPPHAETTASGVVYRLRAGAFRAEAQAEAVCATLRSGGQHCRVVAG